MENISNDHEDRLDQHLDCLIHKLLKTMEMSKASPNNFDEAYIHQFQPEPTQKIH